MYDTCQCDPPFATDDCGDEADCYVYLSYSALMYFALLLYAAFAYGLSWRVSKKATEARKLVLGIVLIFTIGTCFLFSCAKSRELFLGDASHSLGSSHVISVRLFRYLILLDRDFVRSKADSVSFFAFLSLVYSLAIPIGLAAFMIMVYYW